MNFRYATFHVYDVNDTNRSIISQFNDVTFTLPYYDSEKTRPGFGAIYNDGAATVLGAEWEEFMPDINFAMSISNTADVTIYPQLGNFFGFFPNYRLYIDASITQLAIENVKTGKFFTLGNSSTQPLRYYASKEAYLNNIPYISDVQNLLHDAFGSGSGSTLGLCSVWTYNALDENDEISEFRSLNLEGCRTLSLRLNGVGMPSSGTATAILKNMFEGSSDYDVTTDDPYEQGGTSTTGGGDGSFDLHNDNIDFPSLPTLSAVDTGLVSLYTPTLAQLKSLATFLWNANPTDVDWWKKLVANPLDLILGLSIVPVEVPAGGMDTIKVGLIDTGVGMTKVSSQFVTVDCGSVAINKNCGGSALDYSPFTKFSLYLPFIGTRTISCDDIMGRTVHVKYNVDLLSGACTAMVKITGGPNDNPLNAILYQYSGACAISIPLSGETFTNMITSTIQLAASIGAAVATGGAAAGIAASSAANSLMSMKPIIERAGGVSGAAGQLGVMTPYLIAEVPRQSVPENANKFTGYPSNIKAKLSELEGFTTVEIIHMQNIPATNAEKNELESILKAGVIL